MKIPVQLMLILFLLGCSSQSINEPAIPTVFEGVDLEGLEYCGTRIGRTDTSLDKCFSRGNGICKSKYIYEKPDSKIEYLKITKPLDEKTCLYKMYGIDGLEMETCSLISDIKTIVDCNAPQASIEELTSAQFELYESKSLVINNKQYMITLLNYNDKQSYLQGMVALPKGKIIQFKLSTKSPEIKLDSNLTLRYNGLKNAAGKDLYGLSIE